MNFSIPLVDSTTDLSLSLASTYNYTLVFLSVIIASASAFPALQIADRLSIGGNRRIVRSVWLLAGAIAMGCGIWAMHFIAMLAFSLPISVNYELNLTFTSLMPGIIASAFTLHLLGGAMIETWRLHLCGLLMGD